MNDLPIVEGTREDYESRIILDSNANLRILSSLRSIITMLNLCERINDQAFRYIMSLIDETDRNSCILRSTCRELLNKTNFNNRDQ